MDKYGQMRYNLATNAIKLWYTVRFYPQPIDVETVVFHSRTSDQDEEKMLGIKGGSMKNRRRQWFSMLLAALIAVGSFPAAVFAQANGKTDAVYQNEGKVQILLDDGDPTDAVVNDGNEGDGSTEGTEAPNGGEDDDGNGSTEETEAPNGSEGDEGTGAGEGNEDPAADNSGEEPDADEGGEQGQTPAAPVSGPDPSDEGAHCGHPAHTHSSACYADGQLICGKTEHVHTLACYSDPKADVESQTYRERAVLAVTLTGDWAKDLLAIAKTQLGYTESERNYIVTASGQKKGYTRYGDWYGDGSAVYADWCAGFVAFCMHYAHIPLPPTFSCRTYLNTFSGMGLYHPAGSYRPRAGDVIFFVSDGSDVPNHIGIVIEASGNDIRTIEGNRSNRVSIYSYELSDEAILGYGELPKNPDYVPPEPEAPETPVGPEAVAAEPEAAQESEAPVEPETFSVTVTVSFEDEDDVDGRPSMVAVQLRPVGEDPEPVVEKDDDSGVVKIQIVEDTRKVDARADLDTEVILSAENQWTHTWAGLFSGEYTVDAIVPDGFTAALAGSMEEGFLLTVGSMPQGDEPAEAGER